MAGNDAVDQDAIAAQWEASLDSEDPAEAAEAAAANELSGTMALQWAAMVEDGGRDFGKNNGERVLSQEEIDNLLGFTVGDESGLSYDDMRGRVMSELKKVFRPELLNRIDEIIVFHKLEKSEILQIVDLMMKRLRDQMSIHGSAIELTDSARELLVEQGYDPAMGARPLRRSIQRLIEDPLADFVLGRELKEGQLAVLSAGDSVRFRGVSGGGRLLLLAGVPILEPVVHYGPFVMNTEREIEQAVRDYQTGKMGQITRTAVIG